MCEHTTLKPHTIVIFLLGETVGASPRFECTCMDSLAYFWRSVHNWNVAEANRPV
jgi:hypothetical protein